MAFVLLPPVLSCEKQPARVLSPPFDEVFELAEVIVLGEDPSDSIADVGEFFERRDGGFVIGAAAPAGSDLVPPRTRRRCRKTLPCLWICRKVGSESPEGRIVNHPPT